MELLDKGDSINMGSLVFEKVNEFRYEGALLSTNYKKWLDLKDRFKDN